MDRSGKWPYGTGMQKSSPQQPKVIASGLEGWAGQYETCWGTCFYTPGTIQAAFELP